MRIGRLLECAFLLCCGDLAGRRAVDFLRAIAVATVAIVVVAAVAVAVAIAIAGAGAVAVVVAGAGAGAAGKLVRDGEVLFEELHVSAADGAVSDSDAPAQFMAGIVADEHAPFCARRPRVVAVCCRD